MSRSDVGNFSRGAAFLLLAPLSVLVASGCASNVNDTLWEARRGDPESVKEAVVEIGRILYEKEQAGLEFTAGDQEGIEYLKEVAEKSSDPLNRVTALSSLGRLKSPDTFALFLVRLEDPFWPARLEAAKALASRPAPSQATRLARQLAVESQVEVRPALIRALASAGGDEALRALLDVLLDSTGRFRHTKRQAYDAVCTLSDKNYAFHDVTSWRNYYNERFGLEKTEGGPPAAKPPVHSPTEDGSQP